MVGAGKASPRAYHIFGSTDTTRLPRAYHIFGSARAGTTKPRKGIVFLDTSQQASSEGIVFLGTLQQASRKRTVFFGYCYPKESSVKSCWSSVDKELNGKEESSKVTLAAGPQG